MTVDLAKPTPHRPANGEWLSAGFGLAGTLLLALLVWFGFRLEPVPALSPASAETKGSSHFVASPGQSGGIAEWERILHTWARLADPTLLVLPDEELGFSRVRQTPRHLPETPPPEYRFAVVLAAETPQAEIRLAAPRQELPDELRQRWLVAPPETREYPPVVPLPRAIVWHRPDGQVLAAMPELDIDTVRRAIAEGGHPRYPTRLEVQAGDSAFPTRIRVRRPSGNTALDLHAVAVLQRAVGFMERRQRFGQEDTPPAYLPPPGGSVIIEIEWSLFPAELTVAE
ncbi:MAG: hypothetical protein RBU25_14300 [Lentisphaeria bacterium]|jgi:hypothetical protein|nr:hypothetical protein [Lentisphaeria bacterium]